MNSNHLQQYLSPLHISELNALQKAALETYEPDKDMLLLAPTGTGKTLAFFLPLLEHLQQDNDQVQALILVPSRELALQIEQVFKAMQTGFKVNCCYGGHHMKTEINNLMHPPAVLVGTPGRIADHLSRETFSTEGIKTIILDEFDKSLEFGFEEDMKYIVSKLYNLSNRVLTSATNMSRIPSFVGVEAPVVHNFLSEKAPPNLNYLTVETSSAEKLEALFQLICTIGAEPMLVFCNHREAVDRISALLFERGIIHDTFHGGLDQEERERALVKFRNGSHYLLITTDLAARGLDIPSIKHIIHYQLPVNEDAFVHRNGRTARMNAAGTAYLIVSEKDKQLSFLPSVTQHVVMKTDISLPDQPEWETLFISGGKKDKINKIDIVGLFLKKGDLEKQELGLIEVKDNSSYVAVKRDLAKAVISKLNNQKVKKKKIRVQLAR